MHFSLEEEAHLDEGPQTGAAGGQLAHWPATVRPSELRTQAAKCWMGCGGALGGTEEAGNGKGSIEDGVVAFWEGGDSPDQVVMGLGARAEAQLCPSIPVMVWGGHSTPRPHFPTVHTAAPSKDQREGAPSAGQTPAHTQLLPLQPFPSTLPSTSAGRVFSSVSTSFETDSER